MAQVSAKRSLIGEMFQLEKPPNCCLVDSDDKSVKIKPTNLS